MRDLTVMYQGGSGGFLLYYHLLQSGKFTVSNVGTQIEEQFPLSLKHNRLAWKSTEFWPNNVELKNSVTDKRKLHLICNPLFAPAMLEEHKQVAANTTVILLYTDLRTQLRLAYDKNAYWFTTVSKEHFNAPLSNYSYMRSILKNGVKWNNVCVDPMVLKVVETFNIKHTVSLQTLVAHPSALMNRWLQLQSTKALACL